MASSVPVFFQVYVIPLITAGDEQGFGIAYFLGDGSEVCFCPAIDHDRLNRIHPHHIVHILVVSVSTAGSNYNHMASTRPL